MKPCLLFFICLVLLLPAKAQKVADSLFTQTIAYHTNQASEIYLVWATNYWGKPDSQYLPKGSTLHQKSAHTKMKREQGVFTTAFNLPKGMRLDYYFKITKDAKGNPVKGYDSNEGNTYFVKVSGNDTTEIKASKIRFYKEPFSLHSRSKYLLAGAILFLALIVFVYRHSLKVKSRHFFPAYWLACTLMVLLSRAVITGSGLRHPLKLLAGSF